MPRIRASTIEEHKSLTRREILDAAAALFFAQGYEETSLSDIAAYVGIGRTTFYDYFGDKEEVLVELVEESVPKLIDKFLGDLPSELSARDRLAEMTIRSLMFVADETNLGTLVMREVPKLGPEAQRRVGIAHSRIGDEIRIICSEAVAGGEFVGDDVDYLADFVTNVVLWAARSLIKAEDPKQEVHEVAEATLRLLFDGICRRA